MNGERLAQALREMAAEPGILACALVDETSGLVWQSCAADPSMDRTWEAAIESWRVHRRLQDRFDSLGPLGAALLYHERGVLALLPCSRDPPLLLVCLAEHHGVDWLGWQRRNRELALHLTTRR